VRKQINQLRFTVDVNAVVFQQTAFNSIFKRAEHFEKLYVRIGEIADTTFFKKTAVF